VVSETQAKPADRAKPTVPSYSPDMPTTSQEHTPQQLVAPQPEQHLSMIETNIKPPPVDKHLSAILEKVK